MSARLMFQLAAATFALLAIAVAVLQAHRPAPATAHAPAAPRASRPADTELARCQALGAAGAEDPGCLQAWDHARTRFLGAPKAGR